MFKTLKRWKINKIKEKRDRRVSLSFVYFRVKNIDSKLLLTEYDSEKFFCLDVFEESLTVDLFDALIIFLFHHPFEYFSLIEKIT